MFTIYGKKGRRPWWLQGKAGGVYYRQSTFTDNRAEAEAYAARFYQEIVDRVVYGVKHSTTYAEAVEVYLKGGGEARYMMPLLELFGARRISELTPSYGFIVDNTSNKIFRRLTSHRFDSEGNEVARYLLARCSLRLG